MLKILRFLENLFYTIGSWFEDRADSIDEDFYDQLRTAINTAISGNILESHKEDDITVIDEFKLHSVSIVEMGNDERRSEEKREIQETSSAFR